MKYYAAYGSNLNKLQMARRCPRAKPIGTALLKGWKLSFKGSHSGFYLSIDKKKGWSVPLGIWQIDDLDEKALDRYEGYPNFYQKFMLPINIHCFDGSKSQAQVLIYALPPTARYGLPTGYYVGTCVDGYEDFGFDLKYLEDAFYASRRNK